MPIEKPTLCLNTDDPEQMELFEFITRLPNGKKRNASAFLRTLVDREYQKKRDQYLAEKQRAEKEKETPKVSHEVIKTNGGIKFDLTKDVNQNSN